MVALDEDRLLRLAGGAVYGRGLDYTRYVRGMRVVGTTATGTIQARNVYLVELDWTDDRLDGARTCPHHADGNFCKHLVALGLCVIDDHATADEGAAHGTGPDDVELLVDALDADELRAVLGDLARRDASVRRELETRRAAATGDPGRLADDLVAMVRDTTSVRGFIDYRRSFEVARDAQAMLDELDRCAEVAPDAARPALLLAVTRLRSMVGQSDDSAGVIGDTCQQAADLYARACRQGDPDRVELATWLVRFRADSPGWPEVELADFVAAFDDEALATYRHGVAELDDRKRDADHRFEVERMLLELADNDGDVDRAVALLGRGERRQYGAIVARLQAAGRDDEAVSWIDRAVEEGRVSDAGRGNEYWLDAAEVAETYRALGRTSDGLDVLTGVFTRRPAEGTFRRLVDFATDVGRGDDVRTWALTAARDGAATSHGDGAVLVDIALAEEDLDAAWDVADQYGAGHRWETLAEASAASRPLDAARLYRRQVDGDLAEGADTRRYPGIARRLATMKQLHDEGGDRESFDDYLASVRDTYGRRPSLMRALDRAGL